MTKDDVIDLIKDAGYGFLATTEKNHPRVRPVMPYLTEEGNLLLAMIKGKRTISQIQENPLVEICYVDRKMAFCRISGKAKISEDIEKKQIVWDNIPILKQFIGGPEDPNLVLIDIESTTVEAMTPQQQAPEVLSLK